MRLMVVTALLLALPALAPAPVAGGVEQVATAQQVLDEVNAARAARREPGPRGDGLCRLPG